MITQTLIALLLTDPTTPPVSSEPIVCEPPGIPATIIRVIDGDTFDLMAHLPFGLHVAITVRLPDIDTPELRIKLQNPAAVAARDFASAWFDAYPDVVLFLHGKPEKYGRTLARVCPPGEGRCLSQALAAAGHEK
jgi:endonuclease YncB( thermonuclease family)